LRSRGPVPKKVLFVCTGNTCRSPMAEGILKKLSRERNLPVEVFSAGLAAFVGAPAAPEAVEAAREKGIDLSGHQSQPLSKNLVVESDLILTMTAKHKEMILKKMPSLEGKVFTLAGFSGAEDADIADPVGQPLEAYREVFGRMEGLISGSAERLKE